MPLNFSYDHTLDGFLDIELDVVLGHTSLLAKESHIIEHVSVEVLGQLAAQGTLADAKGPAVDGLH